jgi:AAHS family 4-hydroxybenzoate transporter-like MFS transporter
MTGPTTVNVAEVVERSRAGGVRILAVVLCALVALFDGFDLQIIGLAAPSVAAELHIPVGALGAVFSAALAGLALGGLVIAPVADRVGRKAILVGAIVCFAVFTLATTAAGSVPVLLAYRFLTGLGLGAAVPCAISLASELVPAHRRGTVAGLLFAGFPVGGVVAGLLASRMIPATGWRSLFLVGAVGPVVVAVVIAFVLPESLILLVTRGAASRRVARTLARVAPDVDVDPAQLVAPAVDERVEGAPVRHLFDADRRVSTLLLWASSFAAFGVLVVNSSWTPTLLAPLGLPVPRTAVALAFFNAGSVVATAAGGWLITRFGPRRVLPTGFGLAAVGMVGVGVLAPSASGVAAMEVLIGLGLGGASSGVIALAAMAYVTAMRSTGVGWALGIGRIGSFVGPLLVGALAAAAWAVPAVFAAIAAACLLGGLAALALRPVGETESSSRPTLSEGAA